jgi:hypothetical protein
MEILFGGSPAMLIPCLIFLLLNLSEPPLPLIEPDGSRTIGIVPPFQAEPLPPVWLRAKSHACASVDTRHYLYEAYAGPEGQWLVRYVMLPEGEEAFREIEQAFLFRSEEKIKPVAIKPSELEIEPRSAKWKKLAFKLVDRRDLMKT